MISKNGSYEFKQNSVYIEGVITTLSYMWVEYFGGGWQ